MKEIDAVYRRLHQEIDSARQVHQQLLQSHIPVVESISITTTSTSATSIGGDFY